MQSEVDAFSVSRKRTADLAVLEERQLLAHTRKARKLEMYLQRLEQAVHVMAAAIEQTTAAITDCRLDMLATTVDHLAVIEGLSAPATAPGQLLPRTNSFEDLATEAYATVESWCEPPAATHGTGFATPDAYPIDPVAVTAEEAWQQSLHDEEGLIVGALALLALSAAPTAPAADAAFAAAPVTPSATSAVREDVASVPVATAAAVAAAVAFDTVAAPAPSAAADLAAAPSAAEDLDNARVVSE
eukprot:TRINITY_DN1099_c0_g1_i5.p1 TRINITY_DN1099_c0_g1~~TRINITY_DN1099_c0_g1_i5.p1  ORF type:complete len:244 (+),score=50.92 TRINITY_DN1099_c0_g1_i5:324-1055(+)